MEEDLPLNTKSSSESDLKSRIWNSLKKLNDPWNIAASILTLSGVMIILYFLWLLKSEPNNFSALGKGNIDLTSTGQVGDFIGGVVGSIWSLVGVLLFVRALRMQREDLQKQQDQIKMQTQELQYQREELKGQRSEFTVNRITNIVYKQEAILFRYLDQIEYSEIKEIGKQEKSFYYKGLVGFKKIVETPDKRNKFRAVDFIVKSEQFITYVIESLNLLLSMIDESQTNSLEISKSDIKQLKLLTGGVFFLRDLIKYSSVALVLLEKHIDLVEDMDENKYFQDISTYKLCYNTLVEFQRTVKKIQPDFYQIIPAGGPSRTYNIE